MHELPAHLGPLAATDDPTALLDVLDRRLDAIDTAGEAIEDMFGPVVARSLLDAAHDARHAAGLLREALR